MPFERRVFAHYVIGVLGCAFVIMERYAVAAFCKFRIFAELPEYLRPAAEIVVMHPYFNVNAAAYKLFL